MIVGNSLEVTDIIQAVNPGMKFSYFISSVEGKVRDKLEAINFLLF
jgi:hypothetical protein